MISGQLARKFVKAQVVVIYIYIYIYMCNNDEYRRRRAVNQKMNNIHLTLERQQGTSTVNRSMTCPPRVPALKFSTCRHLCSIHSSVTSLNSLNSKSSWTRSLQNCKWNCIQIKTNRCVADITISITSDITAVSA